MDNERRLFEIEKEIEKEIPLLLWGWGGSNSPIHYRSIDMLNYFLHSIRLAIGGNMNMSVNYISFIHGCPALKREDQKDDFQHSRTLKWNEVLLGKTFEIKLDRIINLIITTHRFPHWIEFYLNQSIEDRSSIELQENIQPLRMKLQKKLIHIQTWNEISTNNNHTAIV